MAGNILTVGYINIRGQTGLPVAKQLQIESFARHNGCDILHLQEANIVDETFRSCNFIQSSYNVIENNAPNRYGTASLVKTDLRTDNIRFDSEGRIIIFDVEDITFGNIYLHSGTDSKSRTGRENIAATSYLVCLLIPKNLGA